MVLVNTLTVEAINTALIALQRGQSIVVGGEKGTTVNNITISNSGGGGSSGGSGLDFTPQISALDQRVGLLEKAEEVLRQENERQNERLEALEGLGIVDLSFEEDERNLSIELANGEVFETTITSEQFTMEVVNGNLIITIGDQTHSVPLPLGVQSDWTQTDPDEPDFIKNKIPIWITEGTPQDNMSPVDSITDGEMRPPTSNAVYDKIASLDVASVGGSGKYIESISEVDGKIVAVEQNIADTVTVDNMQSVSSNAVARNLEWKELPDNTPIPDCYEINITCFVVVGDTEVVYSNQFSTENIVGQQNLFIGGYFVSSADFGLCNVNAVNRVITKRNFFYNGQNYLSQSSVKVRYR